MRKFEAETIKKVKAHIMVNMDKNWKNGHLCPFTIMFWTKVDELYGLLTGIKMGKSIKKWPLDCLKLVKNATF